MRARFCKTWLPFYRRPRVPLYFVDLWVSGLLGGKDFVTMCSSQTCDVPKFLWPVSPAQIWKFGKRKQQRRNESAIFFQITFVGVLNHVLLVKQQVQKLVSSVSTMDFCLYYYRILIKRWLLKRNNFISSLVEPQIRNTEIHPGIYIK